MNTFSEYEKIPQDFRKLDETTVNQLKKLVWVVTEKVHGANFSFIYQNKKLSFAKRKGLLNWDDDFFGFQLVVNNLEDNILSLFEELSRNITADRYIIYGELFGGYYPHKDIATVPHLNPIQTGVYYSPDIKFYAFDIAVETNSSKYYLDYQQAVGYFEKYHLLHGKVLYIGKLNDALNFNTRINSTIPSLLDLPTLENNLIEGVVVKPLMHRNKLDLSYRPIIKIKNTEFDEQDKFHQANKWSYIPQISINTNELDFLIEELRNYITVNRLNSAISKIGAFDINNSQRLKEIEEELYTDIWSDFNDQNNNILDELQEKQQQWITNRLIAEIKALILK